MDRVDEAERWLWEQVSAAEQVRGEAPASPKRGELATAGDTLAKALAVHRQVAWQAELAERALRRPASWLRPVYRLRLVREARGRRAALAAAQVRVDRAGRHLDELRRQVGRWREHLAAHRETLSAGRTARAELERRIDKLVDGYARLPEPPAWFSPNGAGTGPTGSARPAPRPTESYRSNSPSLAPPTKASHSA